MRTVGKAVYSGEETNLYKELLVWSTVSGGKLAEQRG